MVHLSAVLVPTLGMASPGSIHVGGPINPLPLLVLLQVTQANPDGLVSLKATYVLGYDTGLLCVQDGHQMGSISIGLALELSIRPAPQLPEVSIATGSVVKPP